MSTDLHHDQRFLELCKEFHNDQCIHTYICRGAIAESTSTSKAKDLLVEAVRNERLTMTTVEPGLTGPFLIGSWVIRMRLQKKKFLFHIEEHKNKNNLYTHVYIDL